MQYETVENILRRFRKHVFLIFLVLTALIVPSVTKNDSSLHLRKTRKDILSQLYYPIRNERKNASMNPVTWSCDTASQIRTAIHCKQHSIVNSEFFVTSCRFWQAIMDHIKGNFSNKSNTYIYLAIKSSFCQGCSAQIRVLKRKIA